jgi:hypothetical protein
MPTLTLRGLRSRSITVVVIPWPDRFDASPPRVNSLINVKQQFSRVNHNDLLNHGPWNISNDPIPDSTKDRNPTFVAAMASRAHSAGVEDPAADINTPSTRAQRSSPGKDNDQDANPPAAAPKATPYRTLLQIPSIPKTATPTPTRRASSAGPPSQRVAHRTPATQARTPIVRPGGSARRPTVMTPHGRAAMREMEARRAGFTPGRDRRQSEWQRQQRETPRDILRALSRLLAPKTKQTVPTPPEPVAAAGKVTIPGSEDFDDDEPEIQRPRLSLPIGEEDEEDDSLLEPPRSSGLEDENVTVRSVELARRATMERGPGRLSRGSFGSIGMNDQFADLNESGLDGVGGVFDSSVTVAGPYGDDEVLDVDDGFQAYVLPCAILQGQY